MRNLLALLLFVPSLCLAQLPDYVPANGLIGWYPLNDGQASDFSGEGHHGIAENVTLEPDRFGNLNGAFGFQGQNCCGQPDALVQQMVVDSSLFNLGDDYSIACWFKSSSIDKYQQCLFNSIPHTGVVVEFNNEHAPDVTSVGLGPGDAYWNTLYQHGPFSSYNEEQWHHVTFTKQNNHFRLFVDGALDWEATYAFADGFDLEVGMRFGSIGGGHQILNGSLDDCGIWSRTLTEEEVQALFLGAPIDYGCTDPQACNYNAEATVDDESCVLPPAVDLGPDVLSCSGTAVLTVPEGDASYTWSTEETLASIVVTEPGSYSVTAVLNSPVPVVDGFQFLYTSQGLDHFLSNSTASWSQAHLICQQNGGDLVSISDAAANSMLGIIDVQDAWIGLYQDDNNAPWQWTDGSNFDFQNWRSDQPSGSDQHCVLFAPEAAPSGAPDAQNIWSDETCTDVHHFLMAKPTASYSCEASDTIHVEVLNAPDLDLGDAIALCDDGGTLDAGLGFSNYAWSTGEDTQMIDVLEEGEYSVTTTYGGAPPNVSSLELEGNGGALVSDIQSTDSLTDATWMGWFWFDDLNAPQGLLAQNNGYNTNGYYINTNPFFDTATSTGGSSNSAIWFSSPVGSTNQNAQSWTQADAILPMTWHHIAVVLENGLIQIHVDGIAATMHNSFSEDWLALYDVDQHVVEVSDAPFRLGSGTDISGNVDQVMRGKMDGISLWNRALTQDEIQGYMNCPPSAASAGIQALWTFEDPSPLEDQSGQGHDATLASGQIVSEAPVSICPSCTTQDTVLVVHMDCEGLCGDGTVWDSSLGTCVSECAETQGQGQCGAGTVWDPVNEECIIAIPTDNDLDGCIAASDVLNLLSTFGTCPPIPEWPDEPADTTWSCGDIVTYFGFDYPTVQIGNQCWFTENLRNTQYANGDDIPGGLDGVAWDTTQEGAWSIYGEGSSDCYGPCDEVENLDWHGRLYNFEAVTDPRGLCPSGWHAPTADEFTTLVNGLGGFTAAAPQLSMEGAFGGFGTGTTGLDLLPQGWRNPSGYFSLSDAVFLWSSSEGLPNEATYYSMNQHATGIGQISHWFGMSVRCIQD